MTNENILFLAIRKAERNGYVNDMIVHPVTEVQADEIFNHFQELQLIFSHDFCKAFFGTYVIDLTHTCEIPIWKYHLQLMVVEENPLSYLEKFLKD